MVGVCGWSCRRYCAKRKTHFYERVQPQAGVGGSDKLKKPQYRRERILIEDDGSDQEPLVFFEEN